MKVEASGIDREVLKALVMAQYGLAVHSVRFWPQGEESYGYVVRTNDERCFFAKLYNDDLWCPPNLETTMATTFRLYNDCGLTFAASALQGENGRFVQEFAHYNLVLTTSSYWLKSIRQKKTIYLLPAGKTPIVGRSSRLLSLLRYAGGRSRLWLLDFVGRQPA